MKKIKNTKGFTLMEMLIVVAIIAILIAIAIPTFTAQLEKAREAADIANIRSIYSEAMVDYLNSTGTDDITKVTPAMTQTKKEWDYVEWPKYLGEPAAEDEGLHLGRQGAADVRPGAARPGHAAVPQPERRQQLSPECELPGREGAVSAAGGRLHLWRPGERRIQKADALRVLRRTADQAGAVQPLRRLGAGDRRGNHRRGEGDLRRELSCRTKKEQNEGGSCKSISAFFAAYILKMNKMQ